MELGPTGSGTGRSLFLLSSGCDRSRYYRVAHGTGPIPTETQFLCRTLVASATEAPGRPLWPCVMGSGVTCRVGRPHAGWLRATVPKRACVARGALPCVASTIARHDGTRIAMLPDGIRDRGGKADGVRPTPPVTNLNAGIPQEPP